MTTWAELRTVALVGTERRVLPAADGAAFLDTLPQDQGPEEAALHTAALLGIARRTGGPIAQATTPSPSAPEPAATATAEERFAPTEAVQLLELMLTGNAGPGSLSDSLFEQWFERCADQGYVLPHRLLVAVLDYATTTRQLRSAVSPALGRRGHWLATQRDRWSWTAPATDDSETAPTDLDLDDVLQLSADRRDAVLVAARAADPTAGRQLIAEACERLDAASRARVLGLLSHDLSADDEDLLEAALDDRSKAVRTTAIELLNGLTESARSKRLARQLEPLVAKTGTLRKTIKITYPAPPEDEQLRDLPPGGTAAVEQQWFDALVAGAPLAWWEDTLQMTPTKIVGSKLSHPDELLHAWSAAAIAQKNHAWLEPLFNKTRQPALLTFIGADAAAGAFLASVADKTNERKQATLLAGVDGPWDAAFSHQVIDWARYANDGKGAITRVNLTQVSMAAHLSPQAQPELEKWLDTIRGDQDSALQRALRNLIQQLSFRTSIDKALA